MSIALVTDSSSSLASDLTGERDITVVPLQVVIGGAVHDECAMGEEGPGATTDMVSEALQNWVPVSTSRPGPERFARVYREVAEAGATGIVSLHLSGDLSGTYESAMIGARTSPIPVVTIDTRQVSMGLGFAVLAAADARDAGADLAAVADTARRVAAQTTSLFYVDTLEHLRRGGRIGATAALLGSALAVKPILQINDGRIGPLEKVRTSGKALARLEDLALRAVDDRPVRIAVAHLATRPRAEVLAERLGERAGDHLVDGEVLIAEVGAALGAHVGPGMVAVAVAPADGVGADTGADDR